MRPILNLADTVTYSSSTSITSPLKLSDAYRDFISDANYISEFGRLPLITNHSDNTYNHHYNHTDKQ